MLAPLLVAALVLAEAPVQVQVQVQVPQVAAPDLTVINLESNRAAFLTEHFAQQLAQAGLNVVTAKQIATLLGQERQRTLLGCGENNESCMTELANALGSDAVLTGSVAKIGATYQVNLSVVSARDGKALSVLSTQESSEEAVLDAMVREGPRVAQEVFGKLRPGHSLVPGSKGPRRLAWIPAVGGALVAGAGVALLVVAWGMDDQLRGVGVYAGSHFSADKASQLASSGQALQSGGVVLISVGAAALVTAAGLLAFGADQPVRVALFPTPQGGALAFTGVFP
jgi:hypothetical protein